MVAYNAFLILALRHSDAAIVGALVGGSPLALSIAGSLARGAFPSWPTTAGAALVSAGIVATNGGGHADPIGLAAAAGALVSEVGFSVIAGPLLPRLGPLRVSAYSCLLAGAALGPFAGAGWLRGEVAPLAAAEVGALLWLVFLGTAAAFVLWFAGLRLLGAPTAALLMGAIPLGALASALVTEPSSLTLLAVAGCVIAAIGVAIGLVPRSRDGAGIPHHGARISPFPLRAKSFSLSVVPKQRATASRVSQRERDLTNPAD